MEADKLGSFLEIFDIIPPSVVASDLRINYNSLQKRMEDHSKFTLNELSKLALLIRCDTRKLVDLALLTIEQKVKK